MDPSVSKPILDVLCGLVDGVRLQNQDSVGLDDRQHPPPCCCGGPVHPASAGENARQPPQVKPIDWTAVLYPNCPLIRLALFLSGSLKMQPWFAADVQPQFEAALNKLISCLDEIGMELIVGDRPAPILGKELSDATFELFVKFTQLSQQESRETAVNPASEGYYSAEDQVSSSDLDCYTEDSSDDASINKTGPSSGVYIPYARTIQIIDSSDEFTTSEDGGSSGGEVSSEENDTSEEDYSSEVDNVSDDGDSSEEGPGLTPAHIEDEGNIQEQSARCLEHEREKVQKGNIEGHMEYPHILVRSLLDPMPHLIAIRSKLGRFACTECAGYGLRFTPRSAIEYDIVTKYFDSVAGTPGVSKYVICVSNLKRGPRGPLPKELDALEQNLSGVDVHLIVTCVEV